MEIGQIKIVRMSGLEVLGAAASVVQIVDLTARFSSSLWEIYRRIREGPTTLRYRMEEIERLLGTANFIEENSDLFSTPLFRSNLSLALAEAEELKAILDKVYRDYSQGKVAKRYWKLAKGGKERQISSRLGRLESAKTSLILSIAVDHSTKLVKIQGNFDGLLQTLDQPTTAAVSLLLE